MIRTRILNRRIDRALDEGRHDEALERELVQRPELAERLAGGRRLAEALRSGRPAAPARTDLQDRVLARLGLEEEAALPPPAPIRGRFVRPLALAALAAGLLLGVWALATSAGTDTAPAPAPAPLAQETRPAGPDVDVERAGEVLQLLSAPRLTELGLESLQRAALELQPDHALLAEAQALQADAETALRFLADRLPSGRHPLMP